MASSFAWSCHLATPAPASPRDRVGRPSPSTHRWTVCSPKSSSSARKPGGENGTKGPRSTPGVVPGKKPTATPTGLPAFRDPPPTPSLTERTGLPATVTDEFIEVWERANGQRINKRQGNVTETTGSWGCRLKESLESSLGVRGGQWQKHLEGRQLRGAPAPAFLCLWGVRSVGSRSPWGERELGAVWQWKSVG